MVCVGGGLSFLLSNTEQLGPRDNQPLERQAGATQRTRFLATRET